MSLIESTVRTHVLCNDGAVRLTNIIEGLVEICVRGEWGRVCQGNWDFKDAGVVCNQLGFRIESTN